MEKKSKKKYVIFGAAVIVIAAVIFVVWSVTSNSTLKKECPALENGDMGEMYFFQLTSGAESGRHEIELPQEELRSLLLSDVELKKAPESQFMPDLCFIFKVYGDAEYENDVVYDIVISVDGNVRVSTFGNLPSNRTFWKDPEGKLFDEIYNLYLENGGEKIEAVEEYKNNIS